MKGTDPEGQLGPRKRLPDSVQIHEPPVDKIVLEPSSEQREPVSVPMAPPVEEPAGYQETYQPELY
jgi:small subunit ribosomal protein S3e